MGCIRLFNDNFMNPLVSAGFEASSEQTAFPASNTYHGERRSRIWRTAGYWKITSANKTINWEETASVGLTVDLTEGIYRSTAALLTELKTRMELIGASTYTWEVDSTTGKIKVTSNGAGGGNIFTLRWATATVIASLLGFDSGSNDTGSLSYIADTLKIATEEYLTVDLGLTSNPQAFIMAGLRNEAIKISPSATLKLQGNLTDTWTSPAYDQILAIDDQAISQIDSDGLHTDYLRYWRLSISDLSNPLGYNEISQLYLGNMLETIRGAVQFPLSVNYIDNTTTIFSRGGQSWSDIQPKTAAINLQWLGLTVAEKELIDSFWDAHGTGIPFFIQLDPNEAFSTGSRYLLYVKFVQAPSYSLASPGNYEMSMVVREDL